MPPSRKRSASDAGAAPATVPKTKSSKPDTQNSHTEHALRNMGLRVPSAPQSQASPSGARENTQTIDVHRTREAVEDANTLTTADLRAVVDRTLRMHSLHPLDRDGVEPTKPWLERWLARKHDELNGAAPMVAKLEASGWLLSAPELTASVSSVTNFSPRLADTNALHVHKITREHLQSMLVQHDAQDPLSTPCERLSQSCSSEHIQAALSQFLDFPILLNNVGCMFSALCCSLRHKHVERHPVAGRAYRTPDDVLNKRKRTGYCVACLWFMGVMYATHGSQRPGYATGTESIPTVSGTPISVVCNAFYVEIGPGQFREEDCVKEGRGALFGPYPRFMQGMFVPTTRPGVGGKALVAFDLDYPYFRARSSEPVLAGVNPRTRRVVATASYSPPLYLLLRDCFKTDAQVASWAFCWFDHTVAAVRAHVRKERLLPCGRLTDFMFSDVRPAAHARTPDMGYDLLPPIDQMPPLSDTHVCVWAWFLRLKAVQMIYLGRVEMLQASIASERALRQFLQAHVQLGARLKARSYAVADAEFVALLDGVHPDDEARACVVNQGLSQQLPAYSRTVVRSYAFDANAVVAVMKDVQGTAVFDCALVQSLLHCDFYTAMDAVAALPNARLLLEQFSTLPWALQACLPHTRAFKCVVGNELPRDDALIATTALMRVSVAYAALYGIMCFAEPLIYDKQNMRCLMSDDGSSVDGSRKRLRRVLRVGAAETFVHKNNPLFCAAPMSHIDAVHSTVCLFRCVVLRKHRELFWQLKRFVNGHVPLFGAIQTSGQLCSDSVLLSSPRHSALLATHALGFDALEMEDKSEAVFNVLQNALNNLKTGPWETLIEACDFANMRTNQYMSINVEQFALDQQWASWLRGVVYTGATGMYPHSNVYLSLPNWMQLHEHFGVLGSQPLSMRDFVCYAFFNKCSVVTLLREYTMYQVSIAPHLMERLCQVRSNVDACILDAVLCADMLRVVNAPTRVNAADPKMVVTLSFKVEFDTSRPTDLSERVMQNSTLCSYSVAELRCEDLGLPLSVVFDTSASTAQPSVGGSRRGRPLGPRKAANKIGCIVPDSFTCSTELMPWRVQRQAQKHNVVKTIHKQQVLYSCMANENAYAVMEWAMQQIDPNRNIAMPIAVSYTNLLRSIVNAYVIVAGRRQNQDALCVPVKPKEYDFLGAARVALKLLDADADVDALPSWLVTPPGAKPITSEDDLFAIGGEEYRNLPLARDFVVRDVQRTDPKDKSVGVDSVLVNQSRRYMMRHTVKPPRSYPSAQVMAHVSDEQLERMKRVLGRKSPIEDVDFREFAQFGVSQDTINRLLVLQDVSCHYPVRTAKVLDLSEICEKDRYLLYAAAVLEIQFRKAYVRVVPDERFVASQKAAMERAYRLPYAEIPDSLRCWYLSLYSSRIHNAIGVGTMGPKLVMYSPDEKLMYPNERRAGDSKDQWNGLPTACTQAPLVAAVLHMTQPFKLAPNMGHGYSITREQGKSKDTSSANLSMQGVSRMGKRGAPNYSVRLRSQHARTKNGYGGFGSVSMATPTSISAPLFMCFGYDTRYAPVGAPVLPPAYNGYRPQRGVSTAIMADCCVCYVTYSNALFGPWEHSVLWCGCCASAQHMQFLCVVCSKCSAILPVHHDYVNEKTARAVHKRLTFTENFDVSCVYLCAPCYKATK